MAFDQTKPGVILEQAEPRSSRTELTKWQPPEGHSNEHRARRRIWPFIFAQLVLYLVIIGAMVGYTKIKRDPVFVGVLLEGVNASFLRAYDVLAPLGMPSPAMLQLAKSHQFTVDRILTSAGSHSSLDVERAFSRRAVAIGFLHGGAVAPAVEMLSVSNGLLQAALAEAVQSNAAIKALQRRVFQDGATALLISSGRVAQARRNMRFEHGFLGNLARAQRTEAGAWKRVAVANIRNARSELSVAAPDRALAWSTRAYQILRELSMAQRNSGPHAITATLQVDALKLSGVALLRLERFREASQFLEEAIRMNRETQLSTTGNSAALVRQVELMALLGKSLLASARFDSALTVLTLAQQMTGSAGSWWRPLPVELVTSIAEGTGDCLLALGRLRDAHAYYIRLLAQLTSGPANDRSTRQKTIKRLLKKTALIYDRAGLDREAQLVRQLGK
mgnify:FL=1